MSAGKRGRVVWRSHVPKPGRGAVRTKVREERRRRRRLFAKILGTLLTVAGLFIGGRFLLFSSSLFALSEVVVAKPMPDGSSTPVAVKDGVRESLQKSLGTNWLFLKAGELKQALAGEPKVEVVSIQRQFPGKVIVNIRERKPFAILDLGPLFLVDEEGMVFAQATLREAETLSVPRIVGAAPVIVGEQAGDPVLLASLSLLRATQENGWVIRRLSLKGEAFKANCTEGQVTFGQREFENQLERLKSARDEVAKMGLAALEYDLRFRDQVVVSIRDTTASDKMKSGNTAEILHPVSLKGKRSGPQDDDTKAKAVGR
jgi:cell division septal protein FtsQ